MILSLPVMKIINSSYTENKLPPIWKQANIIPVPKVTPAHDINQHLRPISLTPLLSKVAEEFVVIKHLKPAILKDWLQSVLRMCDSFCFGRLLSLVSMVSSPIA